MKSLLCLPLFLFVLAAGPAHLVHGQSSNVDVSITLVAPSPVCGLTVSSDLGYGTIQKPSSGTGSVAISATTGTRTVTDVLASGSATVGQVRINGSNVASYSLSRTFPGSLTRSGGSLGFSGSWAQSLQPNGSYSSVNGSSYSGTSRGVGTTFTRYFRFGGTVSGIGLSDPNGSYTGTIKTSATCN